MKCRRCGKKIAAGAGGGPAKCPYCGEPGNPGGGFPGQREASGVFQTSAVLIASEGAEMIYRSMDEVPRPLRSKLLKSTNSRNSATILIADRRGREEIAKVMRSLGRSAGSAVQRRAVRAPLQALLAGKPSPEGPAWLTPRRKTLILAVLLLLALAFIVMLFAHSRGMP